MTYKDQEEYSRQVEIKMHEIKEHKMKEHGAMKRSLFQRKIQVGNDGNFLFL